MPYVLTSILDLEVQKSVKFTEKSHAEWWKFVKVFYQGRLEGKLVRAPTPIMGIRFPKPDFIPEVNCTYMADQFHNFMPSDAGMTITQSVIDIIEDIEPGVHQYFPVKFKLRSGEDQPEPYFILNNCSILEAINFEHSEVYVWHMPKEIHHLHPYERYQVSDTSLPNRTPLLESIQNPTINVFKDKVEGRALWHEYGFDQLYGEEFVRRVLDMGGFGIYERVIRVGEI